MGCLYKLTSPSGKSYIGITLKSLDDRWMGHKCEPAKRGKILHNAMRKYGHDSFKVECLVVAKDWTYLCALERRAIAGYGTLAPNGYNATIGGDGVIGLPDDIKEKHRENTRKGTLKKWQDPEFVTRRAAAIATPEYKVKHRQATSVGMKKAYLREDFRQKQLLAMADPELRLHLSEKSKQLWANPSYRAMQISKRRARKPRSDESKARQGLKMKALIAARKAAGTYWL